MSTNPSSSTTIVLPPGARVIGSRETSQQGLNGVMQTGQLITVQSPSGGTGSVFVPNSLLGNTSAVSQALTNRINQLEAIVTATGG